MTIILLIMLMKPRNHLLNIQSDSDSSCDNRFQQNNSPKKQLGKDTYRQSLENKSILKGFNHQKTPKKQIANIKNDRYQSNKISKNFMLQPNEQENQLQSYQIKHITSSSKLKALIPNNNNYYEDQKKADENVDIRVSLSCIKSINIGKIRLDSSDSEQQISSIQKKQQSVKTPVSLELINQKQNTHLSFIRHDPKRQESDILSDHIALNANKAEQSDQSNQEMGINSIVTSLKSSEVKCCRQFLQQQLPKKTILKLTLKRDKSGLNHFWPQYDVIYSQDCKHCLSFKKKAGNATANYTISLDKNNFDKGPHILGKVRSNFSGSIFNIFTNGANPSKATSKQKVRSLLATIIFYKNDIEEVGPRQFRVFTLKEPYTYWDLDGVSMLNEQCPLDRLYEISSNHGKIDCFTNRKPKWNKQIAGYIMDFGGRIDKASVKNFILETKDKKQVLMFGRLGQDIFTFDISPPLRPLVAIGVIIANFESKVLCQ